MIVLANVLTGKIGLSSLFVALSLPSMAQNLALA